MTNDWRSGGVLSLKGKRVPIVNLFVKINLMLSWGWAGLRSLDRVLRMWKLSGPRNGREM